MQSRGLLMPQTTNRIHSIDLAKGICMILIILNHCTWLEGEWNRYLFPFWLAMAVPLLMIISGYVYTKSYAKHGVTSVEDAYEPKNFVNKIIRYTVPFAIAFVLEFFASFFLGTRWGVGLTLNFFIGGGSGLVAIITR